MPDPREDPEKYVAGLVDVAKKEKASFFVPVSSPVASVFDSEAKVYRGLALRGTGVR